MDIKTIIQKLNEEAAKSNYWFEEVDNCMAYCDNENNEVCLLLQGYKPDYDIAADYGNYYPHDVFDIVEGICLNLFGKPFIAKSREKRFVWGRNVEIWKVDDKEIHNYISGHPRDGFFNTYLFIKDAEPINKLDISDEEFAKMLDLVGLEWLKSDM